MLVKHCPFPRQTQKHPVNFARQKRYFPTTDSFIFTLHFGNLVSRFLSAYMHLLIFFPALAVRLPLDYYYFLTCDVVGVAAGYGKVHFLTVLGPSWLEKLCLSAWPGLWNHLDELSWIVVLCAWCGQNGNRIQDGICAKQVESCRWGVGRMDPCTGYFIWCLAKSQACLMHY